MVTTLAARTPTTSSIRDETIRPRLQIKKGSSIAPLTLHKALEGVRRGDEPLITVDKQTGQGLYLLLAFDTGRDGNDPALWAARQTAERKA